MRTHTRRFILAACAFLASGTLYGQLHSPDQILKIMEESPISYGLEFDEDLEADATEPDQLLPGLFQRRTGEGMSLEVYELSPEAKAIMEQAELSFAGGKFDSAITLYRRALELEPNYSGAATMIGDAFFNMERYDSAKFYLEKAIGMNFADYQAHWFLSSTEFQLGNVKEGLRELTVAHVLNPGHTHLVTALKSARKKHGKAWKEWSFAPRYAMEDQSLEEVSITCAPGWMLYAMTQALWEFEEGYAEDIGVEDRESLQGVSLREKESALMFFFEYLARQEQSEEDKMGDTEEADALGKRLGKIIEDEMMDPFIYYEVIGRRNPIVFSLMSKESVYNVAAYVEKHH